MEKYVILLFLMGISVYFFESSYAIVYSTLLLLLMRPVEWLVVSSSTIELHNTSNGS